MSLSRKLVLLFSAMMGSVLVLVVVVILYAFRSYSVASSTEHVRTAAEMVRVHLTESMIQGTIDQREQFLERLKEIDGLLTARVVRSHHVNAQYGHSDLGETAADRFDSLVLADGQARFTLVDEWSRAVFRGTIPFRATANGSPNCLQCHAVAEGTVLGAVTLEISIADLRRQALRTVADVVLVLAALWFLAILVLRRLIRPVGATARAVEKTVRRALTGDFKGRLEGGTNDDIGKIASHMNSLMTFLDRGLEGISHRLAQLTGRPPRQDDNQLEVAIDLVNVLAEASSFRQAIEEDEGKAEIYDRFGKALSERFGISTYSIYEIEDHQKMRSIMVDGVPAAACRWCDPQILSRSGLCRARRTGHTVDGLFNRIICFAFAPPPDDGRERRHYCVPIMQQGGVASVIQLVAEAGSAHLLQEKVPCVHVFMREMVPVLEARRLTETLRESALRDPLTGLNNRRFLEEYVDTLTAAARRRQRSMAVLLLDVDHFKIVNDVHGHDAGDALLKAIAGALEKAVRASDTVIRFGGEEFLIVLQDIDAGAAVRVAENIRAAVESMKINLGSTVLQKTISIGLAIYPEDGDIFWQVVKLADVALYQAKSEGRNRVVRLTPDLHPDADSGD
jgi:diguanylate cyclase (GGDEF)-like protein